MSNVTASDYNRCPVCGHPGRLLQALWPAECVQCGEKLMYSSENAWLLLLKTWGALPVILFLVERKAPVWKGALMGVGIYLLVNLCLCLFCVGCGRPQWFFGRLQKYVRARPTGDLQFQWSRLFVLLLLLCAGLFCLYLLMRVGLSFSPVGQAN